MVEANYDMDIIFQSTPPCGGDASVKGASPIKTIFQSTPPCGGDYVTFDEEVPF